MTLRSIRRVLSLLFVAALLAGCYPTYDWRDFRPDCGKYWCDFVASVPGRVTSASRDIPFEGRAVPLTLHVVSVKDVTFAIGVFDLSGGVGAEAARGLFEKKLLDDVNATEGRSGRVEMRSTGRAELSAVTFEAAGERQGHALKASARFVERHGRLIEILVIGSPATMTSDSGTQAVDTFFTSLRID